MNPLTANQLLDLENWCHQAKDGPAYVLLENRSLVGKPWDNPDWIVDANIDQQTLQLHCNVCGNNIVGQLTGWKNVGTVANSYGTTLEFNGPMQWAGTKTIQLIGIRKHLAAVWPIRNNAMQQPFSQELSKFRIVLPVSENRWTSLKTLDSEALGPIPVSKQDGQESAGRITVWFFLIGAFCIALAPLSPIWTQAFELTEQDWQFWVSLRCAHVVAAVCLGLCLIVWPFVNGVSRRIRLVAIGLIVGVLAAIYPGLLQLTSGASSAVGKMQTLETGSQKSNIEIDPFNGKVSQARRQRIDTVVLNTVNENLVAIQLTRGDADRLAELHPIGKTVRVRWLPRLRRMLSAESVTDPESPH